MARSNITEAGRDIITDDGSVLISIVHGEQPHLEVQLEWVANLSGYTLSAKCVEADNQGAGTKPTEVRPGGVVTTLPILDPATNDNVFYIVFPETLIDNWSVKPTPDSPVYGFIGLEVRDSYSGDQQKVWKPLRGLVEVKFSPTEF